MSDAIERAERLLAEVFDPQPHRYVGARGTIRELITELKAARAVAFPPVCDCGGPRCSLTATDPRHGSNNGYTNHHCRCTPCRAGHADEKRRERKRRESRRMTISGTISKRGR